MAGRKKSKTQSPESGSEQEFGIYNVERVVAKKTDSKVITFENFILFIYCFYF